MTSIMPCQPSYRLDSATASIGTLEEPLRSPTLSRAGPPLYSVACRQLKTS